jgi:hypothetical protein
MYPFGTDAAAVAAAVMSAPATPPLRIHRMRAVSPLTSV